MARIDYFDVPYAQPSTASSPSHRRHPQRRRTPAAHPQSQQQPLGTSRRRPRPRRTHHRNRRTRTRDETGLDVHVLRLIGTYTDPRHVAHTDGEAHQQLSFCFEAEWTDGTRHEDGTETNADKWINPASLDTLTIPL